MFHISRDGHVMADTDDRPSKHLFMSHASICSRQPSGQPDTYLAHLRSLQLKTPQQRIIASDCLSMVVAGREGEGGLWCDPAWCTRAACSAPSRVSESRHADDPDAQHRLGFADLLCCMRKRCIMLGRWRCQSCSRQWPHCDTGGLHHRQGQAFCVTPWGSEDAFQTGCPLCRHRSLARIRMSDAAWA